MDYKNDLPIETCNRAHQGTSWSPENRGYLHQNDYQNTLESFRERLGKVEGADIDAEFSMFRENYKRLYLGYLHAKSQCISAAITGPSNFPLRRAEKQWAREAAHAKAVFEFPERAFKAIMRKYNGYGLIKNGDDSAVSELTAKIKDMEQQRDRMKMLNKAAKAGKTVSEKVAALVALGVHETTAAELLKPLYQAPGKTWSMPYQPYELTNLGARIRDQSKRLERLKVAKATPSTEVEGKGGIRMEDDPSGNRVRLFFPGKPEEKVRADLKASGFRWAPSVGAWQGYRNNWTLDKAKSYIKQEAVTT